MGEFFLALYLADGPLMPSKFSNAKIKNRRKHGWKWLRPDCHSHLPEDEKTRVYTEG